MQTKHGKPMLSSKNVLAFIIFAPSMVIFGSFSDARFDGGLDGLQRFTLEAQFTIYLFYSRPSLLLYSDVCAPRLVSFADWERLGFSIAFTEVATDMKLSETEKGAVFAAFYYGYSITPVRCKSGFLLPEVM